MSKGGTTIYYDLAADEEVFEGKGNFQFDIYRLMRKATRNQWQKYTPITNVLWLIYVERNLYEKLEKNQIGTCEQRLCFLQFFASLERSQTVGDWLYSTEMPHFLRA
ncbi:hypothetical protein AB6A40_006522 [Gnathostoma spinigerum]|uniref:non-specific serine/threonine protein kinase n=1 Tax=Gnathostoma spinigerum TaxID=75299 RepID=A0ABD6ES20_9BILA